MEIITEYVYVAADGKKFASSVECENYENRLKMEQLDALKLKTVSPINEFLRFFKTDMDSLPGSGWYVFRTDEDLQLAKWFSKYTGAGRHLVPFQKGTPYLIIDSLARTVWFSEEEALEWQKSLQEAFSCYDIETKI